MLQGQVMWCMPRAGASDVNTTKQPRMHVEKGQLVVCAQVRSQDAGVVNAGIRQSVRHMHMLGVIAPFAAASSGANTFLLLTKAMAKFIKVPDPRQPWHSSLRVKGDATCFMLP